MTEPWLRAPAIASRAGTMAGEFPRTWSSRALPGAGYGSDIDVGPGGVVHDGAQAANAHGHDSGRLSFFSLCFICSAFQSFASFEVPWLALNV